MRVRPRSSPTGSSALAPAVRTPRARALGLMATGIGRVLAGHGGADDIRAAVPLLEATPGLRHEPLRLSWLMLAPLFLRDSTGGRRLWAIVDEVASRRRSRDVALGALPRGKRPGDHRRPGRRRRRTTARRSGWRGRPARRPSWPCRSPGCAGWSPDRERKQHVGATRRRHSGSAPSATSISAKPGSRYALGDLELSLGHPELAVEHLQSLVSLLERQELTDADLIPGPELADVLLRLGKVQEARGAWSPGSVPVLRPRDSPGPRRAATEPGDCWLLRTRSTRPSAPHWPGTRRRSTASRSAARRSRTGSACAGPDVESTRGSSCARPWPSSRPWVPRSGATTPPPS